MFGKKEFEKCIKDFYFNLYVQYANGKNAVEIIDFNQKLIYFLDLITTLYLHRHDQKQKGVVKKTIN